MGTRSIGIGKETSFATKATPDKFFDLTTHSLTAEREPLLAETIAYRAVRDAWPGPVRITGSLEGILDANIAARLLYSAVTEVSTSDDGESPPTAYKHEFTPAQSVNTVTISADDGESSEIPYFLGCAVRSLEIRAEARALVTFTADILGAKVKLDSPINPTFDHITPFIFHQSTVTRAGNDITNRVQSFSITVENDIPDDAHVLGSMYLPRMWAQGLSVTGEIELQFLDWEDYKRFLGSATATEFQSTMESFTLKLTLLGGDTGSSAAGFDKYKLEIDIPKAYYLESEVHFERRERIVQTIRWRGVHDTTSGYPIKFTVINKNSEP